MPSIYETFTQAIDLKKMVIVCFASSEKGIITRRCIPIDYAKSQRYQDGKYRYHLYDLGSPGTPHHLALLPEKVISMELTTYSFDPKDYVT